MLDGAIHQIKHYPAYNVFSKSIVLSIGSSVLTRPRPCGIPTRKTEMGHYNQEDAPVRAQGQATSQTDLSSFYGQPNTKAFCLFE